MAKRSSTRQSTHDQKVTQEAQKLTNQGWKVKAVLPGYNKPEPIGRSKRITDVEATKGGRRRLIEVETPDTIGRDKKQQETFCRHAGQKPNTSFQVVVTDKS